MPEDEWRDLNKRIGSFETVESALSYIVKYLPDSMIDVQPENPFSLDSAGNIDNTQADYRIQIVEPKKDGQSQLIARGSCTHRSSSLTDKSDRERRKTQDYFQLRHYFSGGSRSLESLGVFY